MNTAPVQIFSPEVGALGPLSLGVLVVPDSELHAEHGDVIRVLIDDDKPEGYDFFIALILPLRAEPNEPPRVAVVFSEGDNPI